MSGLLARASRRYLWRHPWQIGLSVLGVALGVAVVLAIDLANGSATRAFSLATEGVAGRTTHQILGGPDGLDESLFVRLRLEAGLRPSAPIVEADVAAVDHPGRTFRLFGVDPLCEAPFRPYLRGITAGADGGVGSVGTFVAEPGAAFMSAETATALRLAIGDPIRVQLGARQHTLTVRGLLQPEDGPSRIALKGMLVVDIATAQEVTGGIGRLSRIDLILPDGPPGERALAQLRDWLPPGAEVVTASGRSDAVVRMTQAFELNLNALSLLALMVGLFLIYNAMSFSVVQRRPMIGTLRALGVTRNGVFRLVLREALVLGVAGTVIGVALGVVLGRGLVQLVTQTINDLYFVVSVRELILSPLDLVKAVALGIGATLLACLPPAREATTVPATVAMRRSGTESRLRSRLPLTTALGAVLLLFGFVLLRLPIGGLLMGYAGMFAGLVGGALLTPAAVMLLMGALGPLAGGMAGAIGRLAVRGVNASLSRTSVAIAALMIAMATATGVGVMIESFRGAVARWLGSVLHADIYVSAPTLVARRVVSTLPDGTEARVQAVPGVRAVHSVRNVTLVQPDGQPVDVSVYAHEHHNRPAYDFGDADAGAVWDAFEYDGEVIATEPYAFWHGLAAGDTVTLPTDRGPHTFRIAGVYVNYASDKGLVAMSRRTYEQWFDDRAISSLGVFIDDNADVDAVLDRVRRELAGPVLSIRSNRELRVASMAIFDRTFAITAVLRLLAIIVAFIGVVSALMALQLERQRELGVLRALGMTPRQLAVLTVLQTALMGLAAGLLALPVGAALSWVLTDVINRRAFGWTIPVSLPPGLLLQTVGLALVAAVLAGLYPAWRMARTSPAEALREE